MIIYGKATDAPEPSPLRFSLRTLLISMAVVAVVLGIVAALPPLAQSIKWVGHTDLDVRFVVIDTDTGQAIPNATIHVRAEPGGFCEDTESREFTITTDANGHAMHHCKNCMCFGSESAFEDTFAVHLPWWRFHVTAVGYMDTAPQYLDVPKIRRQVQRGKPSATLEVPISLRKSAA